MKIVITHPHGNQNTSKTVRILYKKNLLDTFWTTIAFPKKFIFLKKRTYDIDFRYIKLRFVKELFRQVCRFLKLKKFHTKDADIFSTNSVYKDLDLKVSRYLYSRKKTNKINAIYSYEDCALNSFKAAKEIGIKTVYDLTSPYWRLKKNIIDEELRINPEWRLSSLEIMSDIKCQNKDQEILLSDKLIVASSFSAKSLDFNQIKTLKEIKIIPYGVDLPKKNKIFKRQKNEKLKILFVGRPVISKGIHYLIKIVNKLEIPWELEIAGSMTEKPQQISQNLNQFLRDDRCKFLGQISYEEVKNKMKTNHVFLFPTMFEGFGQVILEAMSSSLPIITTINTAGIDIINNGKNGYLTNIRDVDNSKDILHTLYDNEDLRVSIAENSFKNAINFSWKNYEKNLENFLKEEI